jgi:hypothetical protein
VANYFTSEGLSQLQGFESSGDPTVVNSSGHAGLYQFSPSLWQTYAPQAGVSVSDYPTADLAPAELQTQVAAITPACNWLCQDCDAPISAAVAADPTLLTSTPGSAVSDGGLSFSAPDVPNTGSVDQTFGGGGTPDASTSPFDAIGQVLGGGGGADPLTGGSDVAATNPQTTGVPGTSADTSGVTSVLPALAANIEIWLTRGGLILLGIVLIAAAAWALASGERRGQIVSAVNAATKPPEVFG